MIDLSLFEGHTPAPWIWNDDWCSALIGLSDRKDADIGDEDVQTVIAVNTDLTPVCNSFYEYESDQGERGEERWGSVTFKASSEELLRNNALRSEDAMLIAYAPKLLEEVKRLREGIQELAEVYKDSPNNPYLSDALKEMIE